MFGQGLASGDFGIFVTRPISLAILIASAALLAVFCAPAIKRPGGRKVCPED